MNSQREGKRRWLLILISVLCVVLLTGCNSKKQELSSDFNREKVEEAGKQVIDLVNAMDNQAIRDLGVEEIKQTLTDEAMLAVYKKIDKFGDFNGIEKSEVAGHSDKKGNEYAVYAAKVKYGPKKSIVYTLVFTKDMKLAGFSAK